MRLAEPSGRIGHAEIKLGAAMVMLAEEYPDRGVLSPLSYGGSGSFLHFHVANVDEMTHRAAKAGAKILAEPKTQFYGERSSKIQDPFGHIWMLGQHIEEVSPEEMQRRYSELLYTRETAQYAAILHARNSSALLILSDDLRFRELSEL